jgi:NAD(P)-dependent dehydrogenase (short-subunit alcohol dehydrogenase family)
MKEVSLLYPKLPYHGKKMENKPAPLTFPEQHQQEQPGHEHLMDPRPISENPEYIGSGKLKGKVAVITGGDSGIGRAVSYAFAKEGANLVIVYFNEHQDAEETKQRVESLGRRCLLIAGDLKEESFSAEIAQRTIDEFGKIDILVNNAAMQVPQKSLLDISAQQLEDTFRTNIFSVFYLTKAVLPYLYDGSSIINTTSVTAYAGNKMLVDYSATKGAMVTFIRSLSLQLAELGIRVNGVAPGPIWTPLIPSTFNGDQVTTFGNNTPMKRPGQPFELAPTYVYLASDDSRYVTGQVLHVNGGEITDS